MSSSAITIAELIGLIGVGCYMVAYGLLQARRLDGNGYMYVALNGLAACCILVSLFQNWNLSSVISQSFFAIVSLLAIARMYIIRHADDFTRADPNAAMPAYDKDASIVIGPMTGDAIDPYPENGVSHTNATQTSVQ